MEGAVRSGNNETGKSYSVTRNACQLCGVESTKAVAGTSGDDGELRASLEWLHAFLVHLNCLEENLEEGEKQFLDCSVADICEKCKSNLKYAKKHGERAVENHEKVKRMYEEFADELQTLQGATDLASVKLQKALGGAGSFQGQLPLAISKAIDNFKRLQASSMEVLSFLSSKFTGNLGLFQIQGIWTHRMVKVEGRTGTLGGKSDRDENERNVPQISSVYSIAGCNNEEEITENNQTDNLIPIVSLESSHEDASNDVEKGTKKKRKLTEGAYLETNADAASNNSDFFEKENSSENFIRDAKTAQVSTATEAQATIIPPPAIAGPSKLGRPNETSKKRRISSVNSETSVEVLEDGNGDKEKQARLESLCVKMGSGDWVNGLNEKFKYLESKNKFNALVLLKCMAYLKPDYINQNLLYSLPQSIFDRKTISVQEKVDAAIDDLLKQYRNFIQINNFDHKTVVHISPDLQTEVKDNIVIKELEIVKGCAVVSLVKHFVSLRKQNANEEDEEEEKNEVILSENIEHVLYVLKCAIRYPDIIRHRSYLLCDLLEVLSVEKKSLQEEGIELGEITLEKFKETLGPCHKNCFRLEKIISVLMYKVGKYTDSAERLEELSKNYKNTLKGNEKDFLEIKAEQGEALVLLGRYEDALKMQRHILEKTIKKTGKQSIHTLDEENRYGRFSLNAGKFREALELFKSVEEKARKVKPVSIKLIVEAQINVAHTYTEMGEDEEALKIWEDAYKTISSGLERYPRLFAETSSKLGDVYLNMNKFTEALEHISNDYEKVKEKLGPKHYWTLQFLQSLGSAHRGNGMDKKELETALEMHKDAYEGLLVINGEEDENVIRAKNDIALDLSMLGRHDEALQMFKEIVSKLENKQRFSESLKFKLNFVEALQKSGGCLEEVRRQLEAIKEEFEKATVMNSLQVKRATDLLNRVQERMQSV